MAIRPSNKTLTATTPNILNAIRNDIGGTYAELVPLANNTAQSIKDIGSVVLKIEDLQNSFLNALVNRIAFTILSSKSYSNPWNVFKKGVIEYGETIEEIYIALAKPFQFNPQDAETTLYRRAIPDVSTAFHRFNYAKVYETTIQETDLKKAFLSMEGVTQLINGCISALYDSEQYDEFLVMKYMLARLCLDGKIKPVYIPSVTDKDSLETIVKTIKATSQAMTYKTNKYTMAKVRQHSDVTNQYCILPTEFESNIDVKLLSSAFNMDKVQFMGQRIGVDSFGDFDVDRLAEIFEGDTTYTPFTNSELTLLSTIQAIVCDKDFFMIYDNLLALKSVENAKGNYWNWFYHTQKTFSVSPFMNVALFSSTSQVVTSVTVNPSAISLVKGTTYPLQATVVSTGFADTDVIWSLDVAEDSTSTIAPNGVITIGKEETETTIVATATSVADATKTDTCTITVL